MKIINLFIIIIVCILVFGGGLLIAEIAGSDGFFDRRSGCENPSIMYGGSCCMDLDHDNICDALQRQTESQVRMITEQQEAASQQQEISRLKEENLILKRQADYYQNTAAYDAVYSRQTRYVCDQYGRCYYLDRDDDHFRRDHDDEEFDLTVIVRDDEDDDEIEDARVRVENGDSETEFTDRHGEAEFRNLEEDCYDITVSRSGFDTETDEICLTRDRTVTIRLQRD